MNEKQILFEKAIRGGYPNIYNKLTYDDITDIVNIMDKINEKVIINKIIENSPIKDSKFKTTFKESEILFKLEDFKETVIKEEMEYRYTTNFYWLKDNSKFLYITRDVYRYGVPFKINEEVETIEKYLKHKYVMVLMDLYGLKITSNRLNYELMSLQLIERTEMVYSKPNGEVNIEYNYEEVDGEIKDNSRSNLKLGRIMNEIMEDVE